MTLKCWHLALDFIILGCLFWIIAIVHVLKEVLFS